MLGKITMGLAMAGALLVGASSITMAGDLCDGDRVEHRHHYHGYRHAGPHVAVRVKRGHRHRHHRHYYRDAGPRVDVRVRRGHRHHHGMGVHHHHRRDHRPLQ